MYVLYACTYACILYMHSYVAQIVFRHKGSFHILLIHTAYVRTYVCTFDNTNASTISPTLTSPPPPTTTTTRCSTPAVPYIGAFLSQLVTLEEGMATFLEDEPDHINFTKLHKVCMSTKVLVCAVCMCFYLCVLCAKKPSYVRTYVCMYVHTIRVHVRTYYTCACWHVWVDRYHK